MLELLLTQTWVLAQGGAIGFLVAAAIGPIAMLCIRTTLERGRIAGIAAGMGVAVADTIYAAIGAYGISFVGAALASEESWLKLVGGIVLIGFGVYLARKQPVNSVEEQEVPKSITADFLMTLALTLTNPMTILSFTVIFAGLGLGATTGDYLSAVALVLGVFVGSALWWLILSGGVGLFRTRLDLSTMRWVNRASGVIITLFGVLALASLVGA